MLRRVVFLLVIALSSFGLWWLFLRSPERQILAAQETFMEALEEHDWEAVSSMLAPDFAGPQGLNTQTVMPELQKALGGFVTLDIEVLEPAVQASPKLGVSTQRIKVIGLGSSFAIAVRERANQLQTPWLLHWRKIGFWPWNWELTQVHNDSL
ncbi:MAG: hypothetical protein IPK22_26525 [Verrucomicrobiaceae bacterium]|nr:hypothetical protein [Verrucomicrobiaceae bacterium]